MVIMNMRYETPDECLRRLRSGADSWYAKQRAAADAWYAAQTRQAQGAYQQTQSSAGATGESASKYVGPKAETIGEYYLNYLMRARASHSQVAKAIGLTMLTDSVNASPETVASATRELHDIAMEAYTRASSPYASMANAYTSPVRMNIEDIPSIAIDVQTGKQTTIPQQFIDADR